MDISVVMCVYNEELFMITESVMSMINQSFPGKFEIIIIVDNPQNTRAIDLLKTFESKYDNIQVLINSVNIGLAGSLNKGISCSKAMYICRMDADDISFSNRLKIEYEYLLEHNLDFVAANAVLIDENGLELGYTEKLPSSFDEIKSVIKYTGCLIHPTWLFKKEIWERVGGYREAMVAAQDYDFSIRVINKGYRIETIKDRLLKYRIRSNAISVSKRALQTYLGLYSQDNVYRNKKFDSNIYNQIKNDECQDFNIFENCFEKLINASKFTKINAILYGCVKSKVFRQFIVNTIRAKAIKRYF